MIPELISPALSIKGMKQKKQRKKLFPSRRNLEKMNMTMIYSFEGKLKSLRRFEKKTFRLIGQQI